MNDRCNYIGLPDLGEGDRKANPRTVHLPDHDEIAEMCLKIQAGWSPGTERCHRDLAYDEEYSVPEIAGGVRRGRT